MRKQSIYYLFNELCQAVRLDLLSIATLETLQDGEYYLTKNQAGDQTHKVLKYGTHDVLVLLSGHLEIQV